MSDYSESFLTDTENLLREVVFKLNSGRTSTEQKTRWFISSTTRDLEIAKPESDSEWLTLKTKIDAFPADKKPDESAILFALIHNWFLDRKWKAKFETDKSLPCGVKYSLDPTKHVYEYACVKISLSLIEDGMELSDSTKLQSGTAAPTKGDYFYVLLELQTDPSGCGYSIFSYSRVRIPFFTVDSETKDRIWIQELRAQLVDSIAQFDSCIEEKHFRSKEFSRHGVNPVTPSCKRKLDDSGSPESHACTSTDETGLSNEINKMNQDFLMFADEDKPTKNAILAAALLMILRHEQKCDVKAFHDKWIVPPKLTSEVVSFLYPSIKPSGLPGYDKFHMTVISNGCDYFVVFRVGADSSKYVIKKIKANVIPSFPESDEDTMKWQNLNDWLAAIRTKFFVKKSVGLYSPRTSGTSSPSNPSPSSR
ncbi:uncharacterized protein LOC135847399 [Planococcus citri]|uniref:uncharacterized protein LOC135847399 n=1 Tax=Planococcus citri TaxID=170843 RepID=UPI0031FA2244